MARLVLLGRLNGGLECLQSDRTRDCQQSYLCLNLQVKLDELDLINADLLADEGEEVGDPAAACYLL